MTVSNGAVSAKADSANEEVRPVEVGKPSAVVIIGDDHFVFLPVVRA